MVYVLLILGFVLLIKGADYFVEGSSSVAKLLKVPAIIIGLTVVAFGTSMPEASVSITAALKGQNSLAVSNVLGSNMFNLLIVLGCSALMRPLRATDSVLKKEFPFSIGCGILLLVLGYLHYGSNAFDDDKACFWENPCRRGGIRTWKDQRCGSSYHVCPFPGTSG